MAPVFVEGLAGAAGHREEASLARLTPATPVAPVPKDPPLAEVPQRSKPAAELAAPETPREAPDPSASTATLPLFTDLDELAKEAARILRVDRVAVWRFANGGTELETLIRYHRREGAYSRPGAQGAQLRGGLRRLLAAGEAISIEDAARSHANAEPIRGWIAAEGIRALILHPVFGPEGLRGCVSFEEDRGPRRWTPHAQELAATLGRQIGALLMEGSVARHGIQDSAADTAAAPDTVASVEAAVAIDSPAPVAPIEAPAALAPPAPVVPVPPPAAGLPREEPVRIPNFPLGREAWSPDFSPLERAALLAGDRAPRLLEALEVHRSYLRLLDEALADRPADLEILAELRATAERIEEGLRRFLRYLREGANERLPIELNALLSGMIATLAREAGDQVRLRVAPSADPIPIIGDPALLEAALVHLVRRAREGALSGTDVRISWGRVFASSGAEGGAAAEVGLARIRVEGRGEGIPGDRLPRIFEPDFAPLGAGGTAPRIGLAIVRAVAEGHQGWVEARSESGEGVVIDLFLPLAAPQSRTLLVAAGAGARSAAEGPLPSNILILEDEPLLARLIDQILKRNGYRTEIAGAPTEAERRWRRLGDDLDLVIVERVLAGGRSGLDLARRWRKEAPGLGVVLLDRRGGEDDESGSDPEFPILRRPFDPADVLTRVREELARRPGRPEKAGEGVEEGSSAESTTADPNPAAGRMLAH